MLTDAALKSLKPKNKLYKVADRDGMYALVQPSGKIVFRYDYRLNGRRETVTLEQILFTLHRILRPGSSWRILLT